MSKQQRSWTPSGGLPQNTSLFLVRAPLTFGHSQLVLTVNSSKDFEHEQFAIASRGISNAIRALDKVLRGAVWDNRFAKLAEYTLTSGKYIKTLVLRASANEDTNEYKVHLVPFFESHLEHCRLVYSQNHGKYQEGGLLSWIGRREGEVDRWENGDLSTFEKEPLFIDVAFSLDDVAIYLFHLDELATRLAQP